MSARTPTILASLLALACVFPANAGDELPAGALKRFGEVRFRCGDEILALAYSPDGKYLASGGRNDVVRLWTAEGRLVRTFNETWAWGLAFSPDGNHLAAGGAHKVVRLWEVETGKEVHAGKMAGHKAAVKTLAFAVNGAVIVSAGDDGTIRSWSVAEGNQVEVREGHTGSVNALAVLPGKQTLVSAGTDRTIRFWAEKKIVLQAPSAIETLAVLDDKTVISGGDDGFIRVWENAKEVHGWKGHARHVTHLALSADGKTLVSGGDDNELHVWDVAKATKLRSIPCRLGDSAAFTMTPDGKTVAVGGSNNTIKRFDVAAGKAQENPPDGDGAATAMSVLTDGLIAAAFSTNQVQLLDFATGKLKHRLTCGPHDAAVLLAVAPNGRHLATVSLPDTVILWTTADGKEKQRLTLPPGEGVRGDEVRCLAFGPDSKQLAIGHCNGGLGVWNVASGTVVKQLAIGNGAWAVAYAAGGKTLAVSTDDGVLILDTTTWKPVREYRKLNDTAACLAFAPDGRALAAGMFAGTIRLFDLTQPGDLPEFDSRVLGGHQGVVNSIAWSRNGRCLVSGGVDKTVRLWEFVNGQMIARWDGHLGEVSAVAFHPQGRGVVSASRDTTLLVWDATLGTSLDRRGLDAATLDQLWDDLASDNNPQGNKALWTLVAASADSVPYLSKKVFVADPKKIEKCIKDLDSRSFKERQQATAELAGYGRWVEGVLRKTLMDRPPEEVRQRIVHLLARLDGTNPISFQQERLRVRRIIECLEQAATPAARHLLEQLARGAAEIDLREMAQSALERISRERPKKP